MNNKLYFLALNQIRQIGPKTILKLWRHWPNLGALFDTPKDTLIERGLSEKLVFSIKSFNLDRLEKDLAWENNPDHHIITLDDEAYPPLLKEIHDPPPVLYAKGNISCLKKPSLAMVGTRKPTPMGRETARYFAKELTTFDLNIVSGLALGIDAFAHQGAIDSNGATVAVMATGIDKIYPYRHQALAKKIMDNGLILTEFSLGTTPVPGHFPRRNRIISGLSLATMVVEAAIRSGSLITARYALEQNRDVLAIPGSIHNPLAKGCHHLLQQGAKLISTVEDVISELGLFQQKISNLDARSNIESVSHHLLDYVGFEVSSIDEIISRCGMGMSDVTCQLADLELQGLVKAVAGGYTRCTI